MNRIYSDSPSTKVRTQSVCSRWRPLPNPRQTYSYFNQADGTVAGFQSYGRSDSQLKRYKQVGAVSHVEAQYAGLVSLLQSGCVKHIAGIRIVDDTNAWVAPQQQATIEAAFHPEDLVDDGSDPHLCQAKKTSSNSGKQGKRKVCQVLGLIERLVIRKARQRPRHCAASCARASLAQG